ncbi:rhomboid family intramembrane serine protease [Gemmobacter serpentinus]|uniref:rhomboid family intramembrane serine protease n=1 Tax=Gemmobacter serpentinus TaxID=2652247 RepID=UPI00124E48A5|nr:rhomboid family intramembrane serine protease [Gemmobacter serpentinus]
MFPIRDHNPSGRIPHVTRLLVLLNVAVFLATWFLPDSDYGRDLILYDWGVVPARLLQEGDISRVFSSMFLHAGWAHIFGNMLFLWIFGDNLEDQFGHMGFLVFYLLAGVAAAMAQVAFEPGSGIPMVGASGAIAGVMGGYLLLYPRAKVDVLFFFLIFFRILPIPAWGVLGFWFASQLIGMVGPVELGGVAYWAHAGGFVAGLVLALPFWWRRGGRQFWQQSDGHPAHPPVTYQRSSIPVIGRNR